RPDRLAFVPQRLLDDHTGVAIQHRNRLLARVQIATDQSHLGLLQPERGARGRRTGYAGRFEFDVVMTSVFTRVNSMCAHELRPPSTVWATNRLVQYGCVAARRT